jgi:hypothetical protein
VQEEVEDVSVGYAVGRSLGFTAAASNGAGGAAWQWNGRRVRMPGGAPFIEALRPLCDAREE